VVAEQIETRKESVTAAVFASRGYRIDQPVIPQDLSNTFPQTSLRWSK